MVIPETTLFEFENWYWITINTVAERQIGKGKK